MTIWIPSIAEFHTHSGLPASACAPDARKIDVIHVAANLFELRAHGLSGAPVRFTSRAGTLPAGLTPTTWQTVAETTDPDLFGLVGFTLVSQGSGDLYVLEDVTPKILAILKAKSSYVQASAIAYQPPWQTPPDWAPAIVAQLAAPVVADALRIPQTRYSVEEVRKRADAAETFVDKILREGVPMRDGPQPVDATSIADNAARSSAGTPIRWATGCL